MRLLDSEKRPVDVPLLRVAFVASTSPFTITFSGSASPSPVAFGSPDGLAEGERVLAAVVDGLVAVVDRSSSGSGESSTPLSEATPQALGTATPGDDAAASRGDHVHPTTGLALSGHDHAGIYDPAGTAASGDAAHVAAGDPHPGYRTEAASPVDPAAGTAGLRTLGTGATQAAAGNDARFTDARTPTGSAGGDLSGTYPNPQIAAGVIVNADVSASAAIAESKLALASDAAAGTPSRRTLGTGATQAAAGNDARLSDARTPTAHVHAAGDVTSGTFADARIPDLSATKIVGGVFNPDRIPELLASKITGGTFGVARGGTGLASLTAGSFLQGNGASNVVLRTAAQVLADIGALPLTGGILSGSLSMGGNRITSLGTPTATDDAATKAYVDGLVGGGGPPSGTAGGDLSGTYPNPQIASGAIVNADVNASAAIAESKLALATDAAAVVGSRRTLGTGALQAASGNDSRITGAVQSSLLTTRGDIIRRGASAPERLALGTSGHVLTSNGTDAVWAAPAGGGSSGAMELIAETVLGSAAASVVFSSIPGTFRHLRIVMLARSTQAGSGQQVVGLRFNGDTGNNYTYRGVTNTAGSIVNDSNAGTNNLRSGAIPEATTAAGNAGMLDITIPAYAQTTFRKSAVIQSVFTTTAASLWHFGGQWLNTAAITSVTLYPYNGSFAADGTFSLYGLA